MGDDRKFPSCAFYLQIYVRTSYGYLYSALCMTENSSYGRCYLLYANALYFINHLMNFTFLYTKCDVANKHINDLSFWEARTCCSKQNLAVLVNACCNAVSTWQINLFIICTLFKDAFSVTLTTQ
jgi:hypothetical protein